MPHIYIVLIVLVLCAPSSDAGTLDWIPDVPDHAGDYRGRVIDGTTGQPIGGVLIVVRWNMLDTLPIPRVTGRQSLFEVVETVSDDDGQFLIRDVGKDGPPPTWKRDPSSYPRFWFYKTGYDYLALARGTWDSGREPIRGELLNPSELQTIHDPSKGNLVVLYRVESQPAQSPAPPRTKTSLGVAIAAASYLSSIVWEANGSRTNLNDERRETATKLSRAISVVGADISRLNGKGDSWGSCSECAEVLRQSRGQPKYKLQIKRPGQTPQGGVEVGAP